jgi:CheY-like chemotaxis protein
MRADGPCCANGMTSRAHRITIAPRLFVRTRAFVGGSSVAKILVADDNSNIQKMVGLALKGHGIDVVAVGNGEAAVRKISDVRPDLVLADVFMPVRNGYEVCKYVKDDKALSHIPVILLVGAFDPLDEEEAQRAGADGVLKKPFVPPDPLISMVKSALVRAGVAHAGFNPKPTAEPEAAPEVTAAPKVPPPSFDLPKTIVPDQSESFVDEVPVRPPELKIESSEQPVAFGSLLETPGAETEEAPELTAAPSGLGMERDWRASTAEEEEEEPSRTSSWRRDASGEESFVEKGSAAGSSHDLGQPHQETWTPTREKQDSSESAEPAGVPTAMLDHRDLPSPPPFSGEAWAAAIDAGADRKTAVAEAEHPAVPHADLEQMVSTVSEPLVAPESEPSPPVPDAESSQTMPPGEAALGPVESPTPRAADSWFSTPPPNPWETEAHRVNRLASAWDTAVVSQTSDTPAHGIVSFESATAPDEIEVVSGANSQVAAAAAETVREEASHAVDQAEQQADESASSADAKEAVHDAAANLDMDDVVAKVLARLSPSLLHDATREILKPVVEAVIREELNAKKS